MNTNHTPNGRNWQPVDHSSHTSTMRAVQGISYNPESAPAFLHTTDADGVMIRDTDGPAWPAEATVDVNIVIKWSKMALGRYVATISESQRDELTRLLRDRASIAQSLHSLVLSWGADNTPVVHYRIALSELLGWRIAPELFPDGLSVALIEQHSVMMRDRPNAWENRPAWLIGPIK